LGSCSIGASDEFEGHALQFLSAHCNLGAVLPNNSPGVHSLWIPAFPLRHSLLVLKPGRAEPWTPYRIIQALIKAGAPREAFSFYPAESRGGQVRSASTAVAPLLFGDSRPPEFGSNDPRVEIHGQLSKSIIAPTASTIGENIST
jgi:hypothetical protein